MANAAEGAVKPPGGLAAVAAYFDSVLQRAAPADGADSPAAAATRRQIGRAMALAAEAKVQRKSAADVAGHDLSGARTLQLIEARKLLATDAADRAKRQATKQKEGGAGPGAAA